MENRLHNIRNSLVAEGEARLAQPPVFNKFTGDISADALLNDLEGFPHAYVLACLADQQVRAEIAWLVPYRLSERIGSFDFPRVSSLRREELHNAMLFPKPLHRFSQKIADYYYNAITLIKDHYDGFAANIWTNNPSSAAIVRRFLEFSGMGPKKATMAANILVRDFHIPVSDKFSLDISVDVHIRRVFSRLGFITDDATPEYIIYRARELNPSYPGIFDGVLWDLGRGLCRPAGPGCTLCKYAGFCSYDQS